MSDVVGQLVVPFTKVAANALGSDAGASYGLKEDLVSYWSFDEADSKTSSTRIDLHGSTDLSDLGNYNAVSGVAGEYPGAVSLQGINQGSDSLGDTATANAGTGASQAFTISHWSIKTVSDWSTTDSGVLLYRVGNFGYSGSPVDYVLYYNHVTQEVEWTVYDTAGTPFTVSVAAPPKTQWTHYIVGYDGTTKKAFMRVNGGTLLESAALTLDARNEGTRFACNTISGQADGISYINVDKSGFWSAVLSEEQQIRMYNSGVGLYYSQLT